MYLLGHLHQICINDRLSSREKESFIAQILVETRKIAHRQTSWYIPNASYWLMEAVRPAAPRAIHNMLVNGRFERYQQ